MTRSRSRTFAVLVGLLAVTAAACGSDDTTSAGAGDVRTVEIDMADNAFEPDTLAVANGETVRFVFTNTGTVAHDAFIGDTAEQADHETEAREADDGHGGGHEEADDAITVEPGETGELTQTFDETGTLEIGCHEPGHYEDGMKMTVEVA